MSELWNSVVVYDLETTGMSSETDRIIQIAAVRMRSDEICKNDFFFSYVNPERVIPAWITEYTGISQEHTRYAPVIEMILPQFSSWVGDSILAAHNGNRFDIKFLHASCDRGGFERREIQYFDTINLSWQVWGRRFISHSLDAVMERLGVSIGDMRRHDARGDTFYLAECIQRMIAMYKKQWGKFPEIKLKKGYLPRIFGSGSVIKDECQLLLIEP